MKIYCIIIKKGGQKSNKEFAFAIQSPDWVKKIKDNDVASSVFALIISHHISGERRNHGYASDYEKKLLERDSNQ